MHIKVLTSAQSVYTAVNHVDSVATAVCSLTRMECSAANKGDKTSSGIIVKAAAVGYK